MSLWSIRGGRRLYGSLTVQGAKNAVLPIMAASILTGCEAELLNVPKLSDVDATISILKSLGCAVSVDQDVVNIDSRSISSCEIPRALMCRLRSSVIFLGALLARCGEARLYMPGGCDLGKRPIDQHLKALELLGAQIEQENGMICCTGHRLVGAHIPLDMPSVGATENAMLAACAAEGTTVITNAAREPEICDLQEFLRRLGVSVSGAGTDKITISGFDRQRRVGHRIIPDRIAAATYLCAAAGVGGDVELRAISPRSFLSVTSALTQMGCQIRSTRRSVRLISDGATISPGPVVTGPYPAFPTDAQPLLMAACLKAEGKTFFVENMFENRFGQINEFLKLGANIQTVGRLAVVEGVRTLHGAVLTATDLRAGAALVTAALSAEGETTVIDNQHIERGYSDFDKILRRLGADVVCRPQE